MNKETLINLGHLIVQVLTPILEAEQARAAAAAAAANNAMTRCLLCDRPCDAVAHVSPRGLVCERCLRESVQGLRRMQEGLHEQQQRLDWLLADIAGQAPPKTREDEDQELLQSFARVLLDERGEDIQRELMLTSDQLVRGHAAPLTLDTASGPRTLVVQVPPGTRDGAILRLRGAGGPGTTPGDVLVTVRSMAPEPAAAPAPTHERIQELHDRLDRLERQLTLLLLPTDIVSTRPNPRKANARRGSA